MRRPVCFGADGEVRPNATMSRVVRPKARQFIEQTWQSQANLSFFLILLVVSAFILPALDEKQEHLAVYTAIVSSLMLVAGVAIAWGRQGLFGVAAIVAVPTLVFRLLQLFEPSRLVMLWSEIFTVLAIMTIWFVILAQVFREGPINRVRVQGAVAAYLLMGVGYAHAYRISEFFNPNSITSTEGPMTSFTDWLYYSFATLSTLGYGDIIPTGHSSRMLAIGEAISGQLFLAILIARLVAMQVSGSSEGSSR